MQHLNRANLFDMIEYDPHVGQRLVLNSNARFKIVCCGRRWGKSSFAAHELTYHLLNPADAGRVYWIVGPTYELGEREFEYVYSDIVPLPISKQFKISYNVQQGNMRIHNPLLRTEVKVVSAERPRSLQGKGLSGVVMSEAAEHFENTWEQFIRPALSDNRGWAIFPSTPKGFNYFYDFYLRGAESSWPDWDSWTFPTWTNDRVFSGPDDPEILSMKRGMSEAKYRQEICAEFTSFEGQVYAAFDKDQHVRNMRFVPALRNFWAFDFGYNNPTVCLDIMVDENDNVYVWREYYQRFRSYSEHGKALLNRSNPTGFHVDARFGDPADPGGMAELSKIIGLVQPAKATWEEGKESIQVALENTLDPEMDSGQLFISSECVNLIRQLTTLPVITTRNDATNPKEGQKKKDDHAADALRYFFVAYFVLGERPVGGGVLDALPELTPDEFAYEQMLAGKRESGDSFFTETGMRW